MTGWEIFGWIVFGLVSFAFIGSAIGAGDSSTSEDNTYNDYD